MDCIDSKMDSRQSEDSQPSGKMGKRSLSVDKMAPSGPGDIRQRMEELFEEAMASKHRLGDILPARMVEYYCDMAHPDVELKQQNKELQNEVNSLRKELTLEKNKNASLTKEYERDTLMENQLIKEQLDYAEEKAKRLQKMLDDVRSKKSAVDDNTKKMADLQKELKTYKESVKKLIEDNRYFQNVIKDLTSDTDSKLKKKDEEMNRMLQYIKRTEDDRNLVEHLLAEAEKNKDQLQEELDATQDKYASKLWLASQRHKAIEKLNNSTISELRTLRKFFQQGTVSLAYFKAFFLDHLENHTNSGQEMPQEVLNALQAANTAGEAWCTIREAIALEHSDDNDIIQEQLEEMGELGLVACELFEIIKDMVYEYDAFIEVLGRYPRT